MKGLLAFLFVIVFSATTFNSSNVQAQDYSDVFIGVSTDDLYQGTYVHFGMNFDRKGGFAAEIGGAQDGVLGKVYLTKYLLGNNRFDLNAGLGVGTGPDDELIVEGIAQLGFSYFYVGAGYGYDKFNDQTFFSLKGGIKFPVDLSM